MRRLFLALLAALATLPATAAFHLWAINEIYSNADGSVQYIEMSALTSGQQFVGGQTITSSSGGTTRSFTFPSNLPGNTSAGRRMLIGTTGFAALGVVSPDYTVPNDFLFPAGGTINFAGGSDVWTHGAIPATGGLSLNRDGSTDTNSPQNFAGATGTISAAEPETFQALWWASPAGVESGWGVNITHQANTLFATWFTYDTDGSPMWLVMSNGDRIAPNVYSGALYRTTGPAFNAVPFNPASVVVTQVGTGTFNFANATDGSFSYTVNGISQTKTITRQVYSAPVPTCTAGGTAPATPNYQDLWWRSPAGSESGWGVNITHQGDILFATWFTYATDGRGMWLVMSNGNRTAPGVYTGELYRTRGPAFNASPWNPSMVTVTSAGTGTFTFTDANNGSFAYTVDGISQTKSITRQVYASPASVCSAQ